MIFPRRYLLGTALAASVALNLLGIGIIVGHHAPLHFPADHLDGPQLAGPPGMLSALECVLSPEDKRIFDGVMRSGLPPADDAQSNHARQTLQDALAHAWVRCGGI